VRRNIVCGNGDSSLSKPQTTQTRARVNFAATVSVWPANVSPPPPPLSPSLARLPCFQSDRCHFNSSLGEYRLNFRIPYIQMVIPLFQDRSVLQASELGFCCLTGKWIFYWHGDWRRPVELKPQQDGKQGAWTLRRRKSENNHLVLAERRMWGWVRSKGVEKMRCQADISVVKTALWLMSFVIFPSLYSQKQYATQNKK